MPDDQIFPCPFCGKPASIDDPEAHSRGVGYYISCEPCHLYMWAFDSEKPKKLIERWNSRMSKTKRFHVTTIETQDRECVYVVEAETEEAAKAHALKGSGYCISDQEIAIHDREIKETIERRPHPGTGQ